MCSNHFRSSRTQPHPTFLFSSVLAPDFSFFNCSHPKNAGSWAGSCEAIEEKRKMILTAQKTHSKRNYSGENTIFSSTEQGGVMSWQALSVHNYSQSKIIIVSATTLTYIREVFIKFKKLEKLSWTSQITFLVNIHREI